MGNTLDAPKTEKDSHFYKSSTSIEVGATGMQGWRLEMEDAHVSIDIPGCEDHLFLAVFDGHAGAGAAKYAAERIVGVLKSTNKWKQYVEGGKNDINVLGEAMTDTFVTIDRQMREYQGTTMGQDTSGCTAVTAIVTPSYILCANSGDSRCVMGTGSTSKALSDDHKPYGDIERRRIEAAGGFVQWNRVDGDLAVSRALGDFGYKNAEAPARDQKITPCPDITIHERNGTDDVLLLACDGLWDVMSSEEAINTVREIYSSGEVNMTKIAEEMVDLALEKGSKDNISAVVVKLPGAKFGPTERGGVDRRRQIREERAMAQQVNEKNNF